MLRTLSGKNPVVVGDGDCRRIELASLDLEFGCGRRSPLTGVLMAGIITGPSWNEANATGVLRPVALVDYREDWPLFVDPVQVLVILLIVVIAIIFTIVHIGNDDGTIVIVIVEEFVQR